ncbi:hypothetical protein MARPU_07185 [Marichromatium purpuratum 984]|uniref:Flagellar protein FliT n=1 Tax=Marichromatium purpuratum 984 TaxID=765910 RepID=W0E3X4_MARPU|nr:hypothetical protein [Marichromatium purpuratum]AHF05457.1 hypothetical protein MARPU_07185 [Marichromatium purpuratum 984]
MTMHTDLITELERATEQLLEAATGADWALVETLQKRRRVLLRRLGTDLKPETWSESDRRRLQRILEQEGHAETRAINERTKVLRKLQRLRAAEGAEHQAEPQDSPGAAHTAQRMRKAYGSPGQDRGGSKTS